eukprot:4241430-Pyramimonas_sp.AAC.1
MRHSADITTCAHGARRCTHAVAHVTRPLVQCLMASALALVTTSFTMFHPTRVRRSPYRPLANPVLSQRPVQ